MSKRACSDGKEIAKKSKGREAGYYCKKCGEEVIKEKWVCKPKKIK
jgi:tRNA(Ile2) C34 agmatinyltransferase TiaS